jgi:chemotaxis regulatin CheY-phosphate phosphatase CheZ
MEAAIGGDRAGRSFERFRLDVVDMAEAIARTKAEIAAIKPDAARHGKIEDAAESLEAIAQMAATAVARLLAAAERIQEISWALREQGGNEELCSQLDAQATEIYTACSLQEVNGSRIRKVLDVVGYLEGRVNSIIDIWSKDAPTASDEKAFEEALGDPSPPSAGLEQADAGAKQPPGAPAEERRDASIEDIGRFMMALEPLVASSSRENADASSQAPVAEDVAQRDPTPVDTSVAENPLESATPEPEAKPATPKANAEAASIFDRIQAAALYLLPRSPPAPPPVASQPITEPTQTEPPALALMPAMDLESVPTPVVAPAAMTPLPPGPAVEPAAAKNPPEAEAPAAELAVATANPIAEAAAGEIPSEVEASAEIPASMPQPSPLVEAAVVEIPPEPGASAAELPVSISPLLPSGEMEVVEIRPVLEIPASEPTPEIVALETVPGPPAAAVADVAAVVPLPTAEEPVPAIAALGPEPDDFLFGPASSLEIKPADSKDAPAPGAEPEEKDPADFLLEPVPVGVPVASLEKLSAMALEPPSGAAMPVSRPTELLPAAQLEGAAIPDAMAAPARAMPKAAPAFTPRPAPKPAARIPNDPLAPLRALSNEEKIALFS